ncbi:hypothetical protein CARUB_v10007008mg [Capsella rubella]|uniref:Uncharacterized protein n=1 Tax=Capsella rubella TaxID=81985 RepID=R0F949_9BRAS|nr:hypothetical protein CARUB_v10007008mg [Capsella rubella]
MHREDKKDLLKIVDIMHNLQCLQRKLAKLDK